MGKRIIPQRRGKGGSHYRSPSHRHKGGVLHPRVVGVVGKVVGFDKDPARVAPVMVVRTPEGKEFNMLAPVGMALGDDVPLNVPSRVQRGAVVKLGYIPVGTNVYNIESRPGDGGKFIRSAGTRAVIISNGDDGVTLQMPSGHLKRFNPYCAAVVGEVAGGGAKEKPFAKAGKMFFHTKSKASSPVKVKGVCMNPVNHPHGGGGHKHVGRPSTISRNAPPGTKVGRLSPQKKRRK